jgi:hypothetical protein
MASASRAASALACSVGADVDEADDDAAEGIALSCERIKWGTKRKSVTKPGAYHKDLYVRTALYFYFE